MGAPSQAQPATDTVLGLELQNFDPAVRPQDDLFRYVNGKWLDTVAIPADKARYGSFNEVFDSTEIQLRSIVESLLADPALQPNSDAQRIRDLYTSFMDETRLETLGAKPVLTELAAIDNIRDSTQLAGAFAHLAQIGVNVPIVPYVHQDNRNSTRYVVDLYQSGLGLPDRDYYLKDGDDGAYKKAREAYQRHIANMLKLAAQPHSQDVAANIFKLESKLAHAQWDKVTNRDPLKVYNKYALTDLRTVAPSYRWSAYLQAIDVAGKVDYLLISQPSYMTELAKLIRTEPLATWKNYLKWRVISEAAPYLSKAFVDANFTFNATVLSGVPENRPRWKRGLSLIENSIGEGLGKLYVEKYFPPENKHRIEVLVNNLLAAYRQSINTLDWMSDATKPQAQQKLDKLMVKIGYPDKWRDYSALSIRPDDLLGNVTRAQQFEYRRQINKLGKPIDRGEWQMTPQTINAYYNPELNEIVFPAAILQSPFFNVHADDAINYGGIGAIIGHEISHGFDDQGSQYDGDGNLRDWWNKEDHNQYAAKTKALVTQYAAYEAVPGYHINGELTLGENIADVSGLAIAYKAYLLSLGGKAAPVLAGMSGPQRFFASFAQVWRNKSRDQDAIRRVTTDPHSPPQYRVLGAVVNQNAYYTAFDVKPTDKMYLPPEQRISIW